MRKLSWGITSAVHNDWVTLFDDIGKSLSIVNLNVEVIPLVLVDRVLEAFADNLNLFTRVARGIHGFVCDEDMILGPRGGNKREAVTTALISRLVIVHLELV